MADDKKGGVNPLTTGLAGAVIGAAAAAAAIVLSDEKNRKKAEEILKDLQKQGDRVIKEITKKAIELRDLGKEEPKKIQPKKKLS